MSAIAAGTHEECETQKEVKDMKVKKSGEFTPSDASEDQPTSLSGLYEMYEQETLTRKRGANVPADQVRQFVHEVMEATGKDEVVLAAMVRAISKSVGKVENGSVRSAVQKEFDLVKKGDTVYIVKKS